MLNFVQVVISQNELKLLGSVEKLITLSDDILQVVAYHSLPQDWYRFCSFLRIFKPEFLIQDLIYLLTVNENGISTYQNLSLHVDNQKQVFKTEHVATV